MRAPPGKEIYNKGTLSVFEVEGKDQKVRRVLKAFYLLTYLFKVILSMFMFICKSKF